jgi:hypothetical protein
MIFIYLKFCSKEQIFYFSKTAPKIWQVLDILAALSSQNADTTA